jgi:endonuclease/exonuclease/phosphatase family metal-dependent hydrolase
VSTSPIDQQPVNPRFGPLLETRLRVLSWNLWGRGGPWEARLEAIAATLAAAQPDVVALQEAWEEGERNQAAILGSGLGFHHVFQGRPTAGGVSVGNAILSRWPIVHAESCMLPAPPELEELRTVVRAHVDGPRGALDVYCTHLNWKFDQSAVRQEQVRAVALFVSAAVDHGVPPILAGDFNAVPDADEIRMVTGRTAVPVSGLAFHDAWEVGGDGGPGHTWLNANPWARQDLEPDRRIDYIFAGFPRKGGVGHVLSCRLVGQPVDGLYPSDHLGVLAELRY